MVFFVGETAGTVYSVYDSGDNMQVREPVVCLGMGRALIPRVLQVVLTGADGISEPHGVAWDLVYSKLYVSASLLFHRLPPNAKTRVKLPHITFSCMEESAHGSLPCSQVITSRTIWLTDTTGSDPIRLIDGFERATNANIEYGDNHVLWVSDMIADAIYSVLSPLQ